MKFKTIALAMMMALAFNACSGDDDDDVQPADQEQEDKTDDGNSNADTNSMSKYDLNAPLGWATVDGTVTGGEGGTEVTVTTKDELMSVLTTKANKSTKMIIYVKGTLTFTGLEKVKEVSDKTIIGLDGATLTNPTHTDNADKTGILSFSSCSNIIIRNLTFKAAGAYDIDGNDNLELQNCQRVWVDHCDFQDGVDGNFDCNNGSDYVCVTWCRFRYLIEPWAGGSGGSDAHCFSNLWGGSDTNAKDPGHLNTTFANCWWDEGCIERMPRVRFGQIHVVNCLYSSTATKYCLGLGYKANIYVENSAFTSDAAKKNPYKEQGSKTDHAITFTGCEGVDDMTLSDGTVSGFFTPSDYYTYTAFSASEVETELKTYAGQTLSFK